ncbi:MAG: aminotransferase class III-fold pyridoxal phosphate-dependent enzyme [Acidimicrobiia bacterium]|nr:aminotransferase class III-fold pyridoxal phosphate-dependent enzyme [Acidimicrobiia bacterium]
MGALWHPFASMGLVDGHEFVIERGEGSCVYDTAGNRYVDATASLWLTNVGYGRTEIADAVADQMRHLHAYHVFADFATRPAMDLADRIASLAPDPGSKVFLASGGSDAIDTALKLARRYFDEIGQPQRTYFVVRDWAYHGMHASGTSLAGMEPNRARHGPLVEGIVKIPWDSIEALEAVVDEIGGDRIAGLFCEPVIGAGGVRPAPPGYLEKARRIVGDAGALFVADEVITGFGRVGEWFASTRFDLEPDLITFAKGVTSGYAPLGGVVVAPRVAEPFWQPGSDVMWRHGYTYSGHTAACVAGLVNLDIIEREHLVARALDLEIVLEDALDSLRAHPVVTEIRAGTGVLGGVQIDPELVSEDQGVTGRAALAARDAGVITRAIGGGGLQVSPPLVVTEAEIDEIVAGLRTGLDAVA